MVEHVGNYFNGGISFGFTKLKGGKLWSEHMNKLRAYESIEGGAWKICSRLSGFS